jgi:epidermal growth factor receptor substrate 15
MNKSGMTERPMMPFSSDDLGFERAFAKPPMGEKKHSEWDDLVRGVKGDGTSSHDFGPAGFPEAPDAPSMPRAPEPPGMPRAPEPPSMSRTDERDDPFLKHLMQMGYARPKALEALEKFDYDIQKVRHTGVAASLTFAG